MISLKFACPLFQEFKGLFQLHVHDGESRQGSQKLHLNFAICGRERGPRVVGKGSVASFKVLTPRNFVRAQIKRNSVLFPRKLKLLAIMKMGGEGVKGNDFENDYS